VRLDLVQRIGREYDQAAMIDLLRQIELQGNDLADMRISARDGAVSSVPTAGNYVKGDIVWDSAPALTSGTVRIGWICTASGTPGTFKEMRVVVAAFAQATNSLAGDVAINNAGNYFDGPTLTLGTGVWLVFGTVTVADTAATPTALIRLSDGTTKACSTAQKIGASNIAYSASVSGIVTNPAGDVRISVKTGTATGSILFNSSGDSKDSTITAFRIG
jgi:hypothetical protein